MTLREDTADCYIESQSVPILTRVQSGSTRNRRKASNPKESPRQQNRKKSPQRPCRPKLNWIINTFRDSKNILQPWNQIGYCCFFNKEYLRTKKKHQNSEMKNQQKGWKIKLNKKSERENREEEMGKLEDQCRRPNIWITTEFLRQQRAGNKNQNSRLPRTQWHTVPDRKGPCHQVPSATDPSNFH